MSETTKTVQQFQAFAASFDGCLEHHRLLRRVETLLLANLAPACPATEAAGLEGQTAIDLREAATKVLDGFDVGVFVRDVSHDHESSWAIRAFPYLAALGRLKKAIDTPAVPPLRRETLDEAPDWTLSENPASVIQLRRETLDGAIAEMDIELLECPDGRHCVCITNIRERLENLRQSSAGSASPKKE